MESNIGYYYDINRRFLSLVGQWPYQKPKEKRSFLIFILIILINIIITQIAQFFICEDAQCIYQTLPPHMLIIAILVKIFTFYFNTQKIKDLTDRLFTNWNMLENQEEREIMKKYTETGKWYGVIYISYIYIGFVVLSMAAVVPHFLDIVFSLNTSHPIMLVYPAYYFVNEEQYFYYIYCHMIVSAILALAGVIAHDCMLFAYIEHICGLFAVIGFRFERTLYKHNNVKKMMINHLDDVYCKNIVFAIHAHRETLQFATLLENTFTLSFAIQMLIVTVGMSITLVQLSMQFHNFAEATKYILFLGGQLFHLFCYSFEGQKLINHSSETCDKIYNGSWYEIPVSAQRLLLMVMRKSVEASTLTAGKIYIFSLENFTTVLQTSMSYFTVLSSFDE
ncbi:Odorant receptor 22c [Formica fusca]